MHEHLFLTQNFDKNPDSTSKMAIYRTIAIITILLCVCDIGHVRAYDINTCCAFAKADGAFIYPVPATANQICGQQYSPTLNAATPLYVDYAYCSTKCSGVGISQPNQPRQWAAPIVQFILPSVIFSLSIPRGKKIAYEYLFDWPVHVTRWEWLNTALQLLRSLTFFAVILLPVIIDTLIWIFVIIVCAAHMLVGALYEAHLDYRILKYVESMATDKDLRENDLAAMRELLVTVASGNLVLREGEPHTTIPKSLTVTASGDVAVGRKKSQSRLLNLIGAQYSFGSAVGSPVIFYLGAFVYTILDLQNDPSDEDAGLSLSFGMEWMIIVHVAIVSGCLLASNNPSTSSGIVGGGHEALHHAPPHRANTLEATEGTAVHTSRRDWKWVLHTILGWSDAYETEFQPVSLWSRGMNKMNWIRGSTAWKSEDFKDFEDAMRISGIEWTLKLFLPTVLLITVPPLAGAIVAYLTPPEGVACRCLSFILYASCQFALSIIAIIQNALDDGQHSSWTWSTSIDTLLSDVKCNLKWLHSGKNIWAVSGLWWFGSLVAELGGQRCRSLAYIEIASALLEPNIGGISARRILPFRSRRTRKIGGTPPLIGSGSAAPRWVLWPSIVTSGGGIRS